MSGTEIELERVGMLRDQGKTKAQQIKTIIHVGLTGHKGGQEARSVVLILLCLFGEV